MFWNCRGLGSPSAINALHSLVRKITPMVVFLSETKSNKSEILRVKNKLRFDKMVCVEAVGRVDGLALFWDEEANIKILGMEDHFIDFQVGCDRGCA